MSAKKYQDLVVWQAADDARREIYKLTNAGAASRDLKFREQARTAASSIGANIVEGFRRYGPRVFAQFLDYAFASSGEVSHWLHDGVLRGYWTETEIRNARLYLRRLDAALRSLIRYLRSQQAFERGQR